MTHLLESRKPRGCSRRQGRLRRGSSRESGYAYLLALFMMTMVLASSVALMMNAATQGRREREADMIWRGKQYVRAIKLYYRRTGHYPASVDDLVQGVANIHFLRETYKDPMNKNEDGKWRFIYTNASGQIIGSVHYATMQQMAILDLNGGKIPKASDDDSADDNSGETPVPQADQGNCPNVTPSPGDEPQNGATSGANQSPNPAPGNPNAFIPALGSSPALPNQNQNQNPGAAPNAKCPPAQDQNGQQGIGGAFAPGAQPGQNGSPFGGMMGGLNAASMQALMQLKPTGPVDSPVIGGFLVGVGSTVDAKSVKVWKGGKKYKDWEFIWNPLEDQALALQQGLGQAGAGGGLASPLGLGPTGSSPLTSPNQNPTQPQQPQ
ncbi:MAG TPA: hypothetical protein VMH00_06780 [Candidatus Limnocylindrales bacterium]|nr:hypothetical protein [Candidatus Limnocylindrales bacterium]